MAGTARKKVDIRWFEVVVSFSGLDKGERFAQYPDDLDWALQHLQTGYLREVTEEVTDVGGEVGPS